MTVLCLFFISYLLHFSPHSTPFLPSPPSSFLSAPSLEVADQHLQVSPFCFSSPCRLFLCCYVFTSFFPSRSLGGIKAISSEMGRQGGKPATSCSHQLFLKFSLSWVSSSLPHSAGWGLRHLFICQLLWVGWVDLFIYYSIFNSSLLPYRIPKHVTIIFNTLATSSWK